MRSDLRTLAAGAALIGTTAGLVTGLNLAAKKEAAAAVPTIATHRVSAPAAATVASRTARAVLAGVGIESGVEAAHVEGALGALGASVATQSDPDALRMAFRAYFGYRAANPAKVRKPYLYYVDFGLDSSTPRGYVFDMEALTVVEGPFTVAHGRGSVDPGSGIPTRFSNVRGSNATSLGLYLAQETYSFRGRSGGRAYTSIGLRLAGVSGRFNSAARTRGIVVHGAPYVTATRAGRSEGCPAMEQARAQRLIPRIANGGMVFHFSPLDRAWIGEDPWASLSAVGRPRG
jgi:hypothetical protein